MIKIAIAGVQGTGKTTLIGKIEQLLKKYNKSVYVIHEIARKCPYSLNEDATVRSQRWIWAEHQKAELDAIGSRCDIVLCDRSLMDNLCYYRNLLDYQGLNDDIFDILVRMTKLYMATYDKILFFPINKDLLIADNKRPDNEIFARTINEIMYDMLVPYANSIVEDVRDFNVPEYVKSIVERID